VHTLIYLIILHRLGYSLSPLVGQPIVGIPRVSQPNFIAKGSSCMFQVRNINLHFHFFCLQLILSIDPKYFGKQSASEWGKYYVDCIARLVDRATGKRRYCCCDIG
jgi:hypothetical protein